MKSRNRAYLFYQPKLEPVMHQPFLSVALDNTKYRFDGIANLHFAAACIHDLTGNLCTFDQVNDCEHIWSLILEARRGNGYFGEAEDFSFAAVGEVDKFTFSSAMRAYVALREIMRLARGALAAD